MQLMYRIEQGLPPFGGYRDGASTLPPPPPRGDPIEQLRAARYSEDRVNALEAISEHEDLLAEHAWEISEFLSDSLVRKAALKALRRLRPEELQPLLLTLRGCLESLTTI